MRTNRFLALLSIGLVAVVVLASCIRMEQPADSWRLPRPVKIEIDQTGTDEVVFYNYLSPSLIMWGSVASAENSGGLLLRDGDLIIVGDNDDMVLLYHSSDRQVLKVAFTDWSASLSGKVVAVSPEDPAGREWLQKASQQELAGIRFIVVPEALDPAALPAIERLAAANPYVGMRFESEDTLLQILPFFRPRTLFMPEMDSVGSSAEMQALLKDQKQLDTLWMSAKDSGSLDFLPGLPNLRRLVIFEWDIEQAGPLPAGLTGLKTLMIWESGLGDLSALRNAPTGLEELSVIGIEKSVLTDLSALPPRLRTLILSGNEELTDLSSLDSLKEVRWVGLPENTSQEQFAVILRTHPGLKILELVEVEGVTDLAPLRELKGLEGLILAGDYENLELLRELKSLRFVGVPKKTLENEPDQVAALRKALPEALVVPVAPMCLGSGWILLLAPAITLFGFVKPRWA